MSQPRVEVERLAAARQRSQDEAQLAQTEALVENLKSQIAINQAEREAIKNFANRTPLPDEAVAQLRGMIRVENLQMGTLDDFIVFIEPLVTSNRTSPERLDFAARIGMWFWLLVLQRDPVVYEQGVEELITKISGIAGAANSPPYGSRDVRGVVDAMRKRHKFLFPHIWRTIHAREDEDAAAL